SATHSLISSFLSFTSFLPLMRPLPPSSTLFPYTTLFRSADDLRHRRGDVLTHIGLAAGHGNQAIRRDRIPDAGLEARRCRCGERSEEHTSELQSHLNLVCRLLLEKKKIIIKITIIIHYKD